MTLRGPTARRGLQFADTPLDELMRRQEDAQTKLRLLDWLARNPAAARADVDELRKMDHTQLAQLRQDTLDLLTDLRAELRRRGDR
jgi:GrpB-like predicted nucleotidyltransferase (UPF0157 family)